MYNAGLVLEGGGMKGIYTAGVLDFFLDKEISFSSIYGVSAGACTMASYLSGQRKRAFEVMTDYLKDKHYMGIYSLLTTGDIFGADLNYNLVPNYLNPYDYETFKKYEGNAYAVMTDIETGEAVYAKLTDMEKDIDYIRASSTLPLVSRSVKIDGHKYLDGGIADAIPIRKSQADGNVKNVVVLTKPEGYVRSPEKLAPAMKIRYARYPRIYELMKDRHNVYNETVKYIEDQAREGKLFVIRPQEDMDISRLEKDTDKLEALYNEGYNEAKARYDELTEYLNK